MTECSEFGPDLWFLDGPDIRFLGVPFRTRMAVARVAGGTWLWSPVDATDARVAAVEAIGTPQHLISPNHLHHLWLAGWQERFPEATVWYPPGLAKKRPTLRLDRALGSVEESPWPELDLVVLRGSVWMDEVLFLHRPSRTLLVTDVFQNHDPARDGWFWRAIKSMVGIQGPEGGAPMDWRMTVRDKDAARQAVRSILAWDFDRMVVAHGLCIEQGAKERFATAFGWLGV